MTASAGGHRDAGTSSLPRLAPALGPSDRASTGLAETRPLEISSRFEGSWCTALAQDYGGSCSTIQPQTHGDIEMRYEAPKIESTRTVAAVLTHGGKSWWKPKKGSSGGDSGGGHFS